MNLGFEMSWSTLIHDFLNIEKRTGLKIKEKKKQKHADDLQCS